MAGRGIVGAGRPAGSGAVVPGPRSAKPDHELRAALLRIFDLCDSDADGWLTPAEATAAQRLIAQLDEASIDDAAVSRAFREAATSQVGLQKAGFLSVALPLVGAMRLPQGGLLQALQHLERRSTPFGRAAAELAHGLVRNTSNLARDDACGDAPPPPPDLWRTATGGHEFRLPPGATAGIGKLAYQTVQFIAARTEDASCMDAAFAVQVMGHRGMFKEMLDMTGEIGGVQVDASSSGTVSLNLYLMRNPWADQLFRLRIKRFRCEDQLCAGLAGFEPSPVEPSDVPSQLLEAMRMHSAQKDGEPPLPPPLVRTESLMSSTDLQAATLVLTAAPVARHRFRIRFSVAPGRRTPPPTNFVMLLPRLQTLDGGHARYQDHRIKVTRFDGDPPEVQPFGAFAVVNVAAEALESLVVEHEFTNCCVRVQRAASQSHSVMPMELLPTERALNLADDLGQAEKLRSLLSGSGLARHSGERDISYAIRLGRALGSGVYKYDVQETEAHVENLTCLIWEKRRGDCSAFNAGFVYALRAFGVPARVSLGFKYGHAVKRACGLFVATHAQAEFYAEGLGWIPCDATLGVKRLGHEATSQLSFVEWRPAVQSEAETNELGQVLRVDGASTRRSQRLQKALDGPGPLGVRELAAGLAKAEGLSMDVAQQRAEQVLSLCGFQADEAIAAEEFVHGLLAVDLGKFREMGAGSDLSAAALAGVKCFEGGPFRGRALDASRECKMVVAGIERIMEQGGAQRPRAPDWGSMWPHAVIMCDYDFEEVPL